MTHHSLIVERDVATPMRDGTILRADVYRPNIDAPLPVLLQRTPYGKGFSQTSFALMAAERGYAVVVQDTRGRWASDGNGYPLVHEQQDGYDSVAWCASQPWSTGRVGMYGASYVGYTQYAAASRRPPGLATIIPTVTFTQPYDIMRHGGAFCLGTMVSWSLGSVASMALMRHSGAAEERDRLAAQWADAMDGMARGDSFSAWPPDDAPVIGRRGWASYMADVYAHPARDVYWEAVACPRETLDLPIFHIGGWYDIFAPNTSADFAALRALGHRRQRLLMGPWVHGPFGENANGEVDFGVAASNSQVLLEEQQLRWFDHWLKDGATDLPDGPPVRLFVMGVNRWRAEEEWPLRRARPTPYYLHSGGAANTRNGDGSLSLMPAAEEPADAFLYEPRHPVPTRGGGLCCSQAALPPGAFDQRPIEERPDVLVYSTSPLNDDLEVTGDVIVRLWAATSATDTDFTAKLVDVAPDGYARNLCDGIVRARYRNGAERPAPVQPGEPVEYTIAIGPTSNVFLQGHRVRLEISSSNFPRYDRNPNTGGPDGAVLARVAPRAALQTVFHDATRPSCVVLPVVD
jgi:hypothetical protein